MTFTLNPGQMRDRIKLQKSGPYDPYTGETWIDLGTVWTQYRPASGREFRERVGEVGEERAVFTIQYREGLKQVDRLIHLGRGGDRVWDIESVVPVSFKNATDIHATAKDAGGN